MQQKNHFGQIVGNAVENWSMRPYPPLRPMHGNYCVLEPLELKLHGTQLFEAFLFNNHGETWTYLPFGPFEFYESFENWLQETMKLKMFFAVIDVRTNIAHGLVSYHDIDVEHGVIEVGGIHYSKLIQNSCISTEAMYLMMVRAFDELGYRRYQWRCNALNEKSRIAAERLGFKFEGIFRQSNVFKDRNRDTAWYSILDSEWLEIKAKFQKWLHPNNFDGAGKQILRLNEI